MNMSLANKVAIVTGASSGIGATTAVLFAKEGADVAIVARRQSKLDEVAKKIQALGKKALVITADLSKDADVESIVSRTVQHFGRLDVLVNNAGIFVEGCLLDGRAVQAYDATTRINVRAVIQLTSLAAPHLVKTKGNIINISSAAGVIVASLPLFAQYNVSKAALNHFTRCAALELAASGVRVNAVSPGPVDNEFLVNNGRGNDEEARKAIINGTALGFMAKNDELADVILFLASDKAKSVTGSNYLMDNGYVLKH